MSLRNVVVAVPTFRRADRLDALLRKLLPQIDLVGGSVLAVDNDPLGSARRIAETHGVRYVVEPARGLAAVRNRALDEVPDADAIIFIDDDELPADDWLPTIVTRWQESRAAAVSGRVQTQFPSDFRDEWIEDGGFFRRVQFADGASQPVAPTNNLLVDLSFVRRHGLRFNERFGLSGGEDILFTKELVRVGGVINSCPRALVFDVVAPERLSRRWVLWRAFRVGVTSARADVLILGGAAVRLRYAVGGAARVVVGGLRFLAGEVTRSSRHSARGARAAWRGMGMLVGALGGDYREYARR